jgi:hypothetical protein
MVAVRLTGADASEGTAIALMRDHDALSIEEAEGEWKDGEWADFDPLEPPHVIWKNKGDASGAGLR